jgi:hypothetical protein
MLLLGFLLRISSFVLWCLFSFLCLCSCSGRESKGEWLGAAIFIFVSHVAVGIYALGYVAYALSWLSPSSAWLYRLPSSLIWATFVLAWLHLLGVTGGYHRLWSHRAFEAAVPLRIFLAIIGLMSFQGSARWWVFKHRLHHRSGNRHTHAHTNKTAARAEYAFVLCRPHTFPFSPFFPPSPSCSFTDTDADPYNAERGLWYSHIGWLFEAPLYTDKRKLINMSDMNNDPGQKTKGGGEEGEQEEEEEGRTKEEN